MERRVNVCEIITEQIIRQMEQGQIPWQKPWVGGSEEARSHYSGKPYSLLNQLLLAQPGEYITFNQCSKEGGRIRKGSKAKYVYVWKPCMIPETDADGKPILDADGKQKVKTVPFLRGYQVFHLSDTEGIAEKWAESLPENPARTKEEIDRVLTEYVTREGIRLKADKETGRAFYSPQYDLIQIPCINQYTEAAEYYSTGFHEAVHSTGHPKRLHRFEVNDKNAAFGSENYSKEELTAEIGAASILHQLGIGTPGSLKNSAAYVQNWLKALKDDNRLIISAAGRAEKAVRMILGQRSEQEPAEA